MTAIASDAKQSPPAGNSTERIFFFLGALSGFVAVAAGAFGAHALKGRLEPERMAVYETAVRYQAYHAFALFAAAWAAARWPGKMARAAGWLFALGTILFCGSLYALAGTGLRVLGAITPLGGVAWLLGWLSLAGSILKPNRP